MNYASVVFAGFALISVVFAGFAAISVGWYFIRGRKEFSGPPVPTDAEPGEETVVAGLAVQDSRQDIEGRGDKDKVVDGSPDSSKVY